MKSIGLVGLLCLCTVTSAIAEIYKSVDAEGHVTYSSTPSKGAKKLGLEVPLSSQHSSQKPAARPDHARNNSSPSDFPKVDKSTQKYRDGTRHKILADELAIEEKLLLEARTNFKQNEGVRDETHSGVKLQQLRDEVTLHEKNVSALKTELSHLK